MKGGAVHEQDPAWLQRGCGTAGFTFAQKPYSFLFRLPQNVGGSSSLVTKLMRLILFTLLKPKCRV